MSKKLALLVVLVVGAMPIIVCTPSTPEPIAPVPTVTPPGTGDWYSLYFTDPTNPDSDNYRGGPDEVLAEAIRQARLSVDVAIYDFNLRSLRDALIAVHQTGVPVRLVTESDNMDEVELQDLIDAGIPVLGDRRESLMHNKFVVIDRLEVWTGSMNFTSNGAYLNDNNLIRVRSSRLAENYTAEFEEMFVQDFFGNRTVENTPHPNLSLERARLETYFSPDDGTAAHIVELIQGAQENIAFMVYSFTSDDIATALLEKAYTGVSVTGVFEEIQYYANIGTEYDRLLNGGLDVRLDGNSRNMHHKVLIIDGQTVITGSYNFSASAEERNDENTLVIHSPEVAAAYTRQFQEIFNQAQP